MKDLDPRYAAVEGRLAEARRVLAVTGGKGGIGKSMVASTLALLLARRGLRVGLLDLDLTAPTDHVILGLGDRFLTEEFGVEPPVVEGVHLMSVSFLVGDRPAPLRGDDITNAMLEILSITHWQGLDALVIDMPPGLGDATLDVIRLIRRAEYLMVANGSRVVRETVRRMARLLGQLEVPVVGMIENMARGKSGAVRAMADEFGLPLLGSLPWDEAVEDAVGDPAALAKTRFAGALDEVAGALFESADPR
jgi:ATP-binding protein involved in chromosome partitioning